MQAMTSSIADHGEQLAPLMREAGFRYCFLASRTFLKGSAIPARQLKERVA